MVKEGGRTLLGKIAKLYYEHDYTHQQIADMLGWNRVKVTRALAEARQRGIVQITVNSDEPIFVDLELKLEERFGLAKVWVSPPPPAKKPSHPLAVLGAQAVEQLIADGLQVSVGLSAAAFAQAFGGTARSLAAPVFTGSVDVFEVMRSDDGLREAFELACESDVALVGVGGVVPDASIFIRNDLSEIDADALRAAGAIGDINARFFDQTGTPVHTPRTKLVLGPSLDDFKRIPIRAAVAAGGNKVEAIAGAVEGALITHLITDEPTASALLDRSTSPPPQSGE